MLDGILLKYHDNINSMIKIRWKQLWLFWKTGGTGHSGYEGDLGACDGGPQPHPQHRRLPWQDSRHHWGANLSFSFWETSWLCCRTGQRLWLWVGFQGWGWTGITGAKHYLVLYKLLLAVFFTSPHTEIQPNSIHLAQRMVLLSCSHWHMISLLCPFSLFTATVFSSSKFATRYSPMPMALASTDWQLRARKMTGELYSGWHASLFWAAIVFWNQNFKSHTQEEALKYGTPAAIDHIYPSAVPLERLNLFEHPVHEGRVHANSSPSQLFLHWFFVQILNFENPVL